MGCGGFEQTISRILYLWILANPQGAIIYPGRSFEYLPVEVERPYKGSHPIYPAASRPL